MSIKSILFAVIVVMFASGTAATITFDSGQTFYLEDYNSSIELNKSISVSSATLFGSKLELNNTNISIRRGNNKTLKTRLLSLDTSFPDGSTFINLSVEFNSTNSNTTIIELEGLTTESGDFKLSYAGRSETIQSTSSLKRNISDQDYTFSLVFNKEEQTSDNQDTSSDSGGSGSGGGFSSSTTTEPENCLEVSTDSITLSEGESSAEIEMENTCTEEITADISLDNLTVADLQTSSVTIQANSSTTVALNRDIEQNLTQDYLGTLTATHQQVTERISLTIEREQTENTSSTSIVAVENTSQGTSINLNLENETDVENLTVEVVSSDGEVVYETTNSDDEIIIPKMLQSGNYTVEVKASTGNRTITSQTALELPGSNTRTRKKPEKNTGMILAAAISVLILFVLIWKRKTVLSRIPFISQQ